EGSSVRATASAPAGKATVAVPQARAAVAPQSTEAVAERRSAQTGALATDVALWAAFVASLKLPPIAAQLAAQTELTSIAGNVLTLALPAAHKHLAEQTYSH